ncbi:Prephenate dehydratase [Komagataella phaffii CBS 7435]|uniref:prephenate dehydratase n=2 Tax=Komagataella phaffii TaxID=460519 RepID=C4R7W3_KOMPG|nr:Prephenate dehydratase, catalyzes the conversion of prephanate to phenylpyruvate [Komagataella phaffii GS115]AOA64853.1 GQ67_04795T0 [Komagataella phaffii]CAH2450924.1 prephenate dehydratase PHA2 [Komagataella phaffii CBS 7435]AOA70179.1 GQ68_04767T0 [Komagataella phaffii GS115]CAY71688.1 Prephenate dehydratase, catalyzes the conversion of prephanate to phenylpyruvate [Komagataella phaffii GS115]CCA40709.1 Prephenate dehydratase [Komagataella phaffii CBS 7435]
MTNIAYLGPQGTYSHKAALQEFANGENFTYEPQTTIRSCINALSDKTVSYAVIPFENSSNGQVVFSYDYLKDWFMNKEGNTPDFRVVGEQFVSIHHNLITNAPSLDKITKIYSHPQVWSQCNRFFEANDKVFPKSLEKIDCSSTSRAVQIVKETVEKGDEYVAAIASDIAAELHNVPVFQANIEDFDENTTRFLILGYDSLPLTTDKSSKTLTLMAFMLKKDDNHGALCDALACFKEHGINLQTIASRPSKMKSWHYIFFIEFWDDQDENTVNALEKLNDYVQEKFVLGTFPRSKKYWD